MDSQTLMLICSSLLIVSILVGISVYFFMYKKEEETAPPETEPPEITRSIAIAVTTTPVPTTPAPTTPTPRPTTAAPYEIGQAIKCASNDVGGGATAIYRYDGKNVLRRYPDASTAQQWDGNYLDYKSIDCMDLQMGSDMGPKLETGEVIDPDYVNLPKEINTNYRNIPRVCYSAAGGKCNELRNDDCEAQVKTLAKYPKTAGDFVIRKDANTTPTLVWNTGTQYLADDAEFILGDDGILRIVSKDTNYWRSSNSESTNGPFSAQLEKVEDKCRISIYDKDNTNLWSSA